MHSSAGRAAAWLAAGGLLAFVLLRMGGPGGAQEGPPIAVDQPRQGPAASASGGAGVYVHVTGAVRRPGLYRMPQASRVAAAVEAAGGPTRAGDLAGVNIAARVADGQQIVVPRRGRRDVAAAPARGGVASDGPLSLANADVEQLDALDGIGPTLARRIVAYRDAHGGFRSVEELRQVEGIGEKRLAALREAVTP